MIPYGRQTIEEDDIEEVIGVLRSDYLTTGPKIAEFEKLVADYVGAKYAVAISNDTAALHAACHAAGIGPGDEVITTPITFAASSNCVLYCGGTPVFADVDPKSFNIDPEDIKRRQSYLFTLQDSHVIWMRSMRSRRNIIWLSLRMLHMRLVRNIKEK